MTLILLRLSNGSRVLDRPRGYCVFGSIADPRRPRHDGGQVRYTPTGYECRCANLQAVKP